MCLRADGAIFRESKVQMSKVKFVYSVLSEITKSLNVANYAERMHVRLTVKYDYNSANGS